MFNKQLSGSNKKRGQMEMESQDSIALNEANGGFKLYHPHRHVKMKIFSAVFLLVACVGTAFTAGVTIGSSQAGKSQYNAEKKTMDMYTSEWWSSSSDESDESEPIEENASYGGFCWDCGENSGPRGWDWWFGWGACPCNDGWIGSCCDISLDAVDGGFSDWSAVSECVSDNGLGCGWGKATKTRECNNPSPKNGGTPCMGAYSEEEVCDAGECADDGDGHIYKIMDYAEYIAAKAEVFQNNLHTTVGDLWDVGLCNLMASTNKVQAAYFNSLGSTVMFEGVNFLRGFKWWGMGSWGDWFAGERWEKPVSGEEIDIVPYTAVTGFNYGKDFMNDFFTADKNPSWEDDSGHDSAIAMLTGSLKNGDATCLTHVLEPRFPFDHEMLMKAAWDGFTWFNYDELKYASNGDFGYHLVNQRSEAFHGTKDVLGLLMTETVFSVHLTYNEVLDQFELDLSDMEQFSKENMPDGEGVINGYAGLGGKATFKFDNDMGVDDKMIYGRLKTTSITYDGVTYNEQDFADPAVMEAEANNKWIGWRYAEKVIMSSLLAQTNLILHVKGLHLELAAAFQGVTIKSFKNNVDHPVRRLLDQFTHRSVQATNGNFDLLFEHKAAEFSLAPLYYQAQLTMIEWYINNKPLSMATLSMEEFAEDRNMAQFSSKPPRDSEGKPTRFFWRWHYRALKAQNMYKTMIDCWVDKNYGGDWSQLLTNSDVVQWWTLMKSHLPSINQAIQQHPEWISNGDLTQDSFTKVVSTLMTWVSHIHEDVGHSAAYVVYNPIHTPMMVPKDGVGVPLNSFAFNTNAYRTFVFLERAKLLEEPAPFWFDDAKDDKQCYTDMQTTYTNLGANDDAFSECG
eukprot:CAMPEP_0118646518 /NCGR_PEP_ID=MMETSP0785-20121206/8103_1 /TAXON_ID=91992 /ORGANISM="Bolidomonas pacifica, Strain CCMP 1866" /LENGTH=849 /DNA_ID=CAMNT_0006538525 /DNA_START=21 /DNA_END=2567 /DNA_ORIENTATION=-